MTSKILESLKTKYHSVIQKIIDENEPFYQFEIQVHWNFFHDDNVALVAFCDKGFNIQINILAVVKAYEELNQPLMIELFILHEIRHLFQRFCVQDLYYNDPPKLAIPQAQQWANEFNNYIKATDNIELYYSQSIEFDAFSFSHAVMLYKYGNVEYIIPPKFWTKEHRLLMLCKCGSSTLLTIIILKVTKKCTKIIGKICACISACLGIYKYNFFSKVIQNGIWLCNSSYSCKTSFGVR